MKPLALNHDPRTAPVLGHWVPDLNDTGGGGFILTGPQLARRDFLVRQMRAQAARGRMETADQFFKMLQQHYGWRPCGGGGPMPGKVNHHGATMEVAAATIRRAWSGGATMKDFSRAVAVLGGLGARHG